MYCHGWLVDGLSVHTMLDGAQNKQRAEEQHLKNYSELLTDKAKGLKSKAKLTTTTMEFVSER